ncbi:out at first protein homolog isoform X2 [Rhinichthys klamathensis goyatoka]|uniref:out at first protein homolog isoform X2 n=1 Tax=Rhinichthys klamathensis goyatoka TaxID=3034132 RepID=UPI0024B5E9FB|nr:out at first protein homolog isoform X2 [Rhinichthys klamathensis goyatoka]
MNARVTLPASVQIAFVVFTLVFSVSVCSQLTVLVRLNDGQITEELLEADSKKDIITVEFKQADGTLITFLSDFKRKNPHLVRSAEERRGVEQFTMNAVLNMSRSWHLSTHIHNVCGDARDLVYTRQQDVKHWLDKGVEGSIFEVFPQSLNVSGLQSCSSTTDPWQPCACTYRLNLEWFPCQLKYCRGQGSNPYKCGIKSCSKGYRFDFYTHHKHLCLWDEDT